MEEQMISDSDIDEQKQKLIEEIKKTDFVVAFVHVKGGIMSFTLGAGSTPTLINMAKALNFIEKDMLSLLAGELGEERLQEIYEELGPTKNTKLKYKREIRRNEDI